MCVFATGSDSSSPSSPHNDSNISAENPVPIGSEQTHERDLQSLGNERVSLHTPQERTLEVFDTDSTNQSPLLFLVTISAPTIEDEDPFTLKTDSNLQTEYIQDAADIAESYTADRNHEERLDISPQASAERVFFDEISQTSLQLDGDSIPTKVKSPNSSEFDMHLPLSPMETEAFDEMKSLEAINDVISERGQVALSSDLQSVDTTPFVKEELKEKIKLRRKKKGLPLPRVEHDSPTPDILTAEEEESRRQRRERNRIAAAKCRRKKKTKAQEKKTARQHMVEQNLALLEEMNQLKDEKVKLQAMLNSHLQGCNRRDIIHIEIPEITRVKINTSQLEISDSDSMEDELSMVMNESQSSDSESIDLTEDVGDHMINSSLVDAMANETDLSSAAEALQRAVTVLNYLGGECLSSSGN